MSRIDSRTPAPHNRALLLTILFLNALAGGFVCQPFFLAHGAGLAAIGCAASFLLPRRRAPLDRALGGVAVLAGVVVLMPFSAYLPLVVACFAGGLQAGFAAQEIARLDLVAEQHASVWAGIAAAHLAYVPLIVHAGDRVPYDIAAVCLSASAALWFRMGLARRARAGAVAGALVAVGALLFHLRKQLVHPPQLVSLPWQLTLSLFFLALAAWALLQWRHRSARTSSRLFGYLFLASLGTGMLVALGGPRLASEFSDFPSYAWMAQGLFLLGAAAASVMWRALVGKSTLRWLVWLLVTTLGCFLLILMAPWLMFMDAFYGWSAPWLWCLVLLCGGALVGPVTIAGLQLVAIETRSAARAALSVVLASLGLGYALAWTLPMERVNLAILASAALLLAILAAGASYKSRSA